VNDLLAAINRDGFVLVSGAFSDTEAASLAADLAESLAVARGEAVRGSESGHAFAARDLLELWPAATRIWRRPPLTDLLAAALGPAFGLVRGLYFDKPPDQTWSLPWHKDMTVAVRDNRVATTHFAKPTTKVGVPHFEAPESVLDGMLTARIHLDPATVANGALWVIPGSHRLGKTMPPGDARSVMIAADAGDVLLMRPLLAHASRKSEPGCRLHRRIVHLEFAAECDLPDGVSWRTFIA
jgi:hypothetical protein